MKINTPTALILLSSSMFFVACGGDDPDPATEPSDPADMSAASAPDMRDVVDIDEDMSAVDMSMEVDVDMKDDAADMRVESPAPDVPTEAAALFAWLVDESYGEWEAESAVHSSTGPHGSVRTFVNSTLATSLEAGNTSHPVGAAAVKELHGAQGVTGWAVEVKVSDTAGDGNDWYWYEVFSTTDGSRPVVDGTGASLCTGCHSAGVDFVTTPWPLQ